MFEVSPSYIKQLLMPNGKSKAGRRIWSVDLETVWLPLFHATNIMGDTAIPAESLGAPIRLSYDKDGAVKFGRTSRPQTRVVRDISQCVMLIRENFVANLQDYTHQVAEGKANEYKHSVITALKAGKPILDNDKAELSKAVKAQVEQALREAESQPPADQPPADQPPADQPQEAKKQAVTA